MAPPKPTLDLGPPGQHFGKSDLERMGIFIEMEYLDPRLKNKLNDANAVLKGRQMYPGYPKSKEEGYFQKEFQRVFTKEAYSSPFRRDLQAQMASKQKNLTPMAFSPANTPKIHSTPDDYFGCFGPKLPAFSPAPRPRKPYVKELPNAMTNPGKKGGPGCVGITINKFPEHMKEFYDETKVRRKKTYQEHMKGVRAGPLLSSVCPQPYFNNNPYYTVKPAPYYRIPPRPAVITFGAGRFLPSSPTKTGDGGCINKYPRAAPLPKLKRVVIKPREDKIFYPQTRIKPTPTKSILSHNIDMVVNAKNWQTFTPVVYPASMQAAVAD